MLERLKKALVESFVGAIGLGYLLATSISHLANIFASPIAGWVSRKEYGEMMPKVFQGFSYQEALPELARLVVILVVWYFLVRWLFFKPVEKETAAHSPE
jgi:fructose-specific phosphotransferase system IIC component